MRVGLSSTLQNGNYSTTSAPVLQVNFVSAENTLFRAGTSVHSLNESIFLTGVLPMTNVITQIINTNKSRDYQLDLY